MKWRGYNNALLFFMAVPFSTFGPVIARSLVDTKQSWRWSYYLNLIVVGLCIIFAVIFYHPPVFHQLHTRESKKAVLKNLDYLGIFLFIAGLVLFLLGLNWGGQIYPWASAHTLSPLLVGIVVLCAFFLWEIYGAKQPLLPPTFLANLPFGGIIMAAGAASAVFYPLNVLWPMQISTLWATDPIRIGWLSCTLGGGTLTGQIFAGLLISHARPKWQLIAAATAMTAFIGGKSHCSSPEVCFGR
jgi:MFS family permease